MVNCPSALSPEQTVAVLHIAQEVLTNVRNHARASRVDVSACHTAGQLVVTIADDGVGQNGA